MLKTSTALVLSSWLWAACLTPCLAAEPEAQSPGLVQKVEHAIERGAEAAASGVQRGVKAAAHGIERAASATAHGVRAAAGGVAHGASAAAHGVDVAASKVQGVVAPGSAPASTP